MIERAAAIHCLTEAESVDALAWGPPVFIVGNGVYLPSKDQCAGPGTQDHLRLLFIGRLDINHKGLDLLLEACYLARGVLQRAGARLVIHGPSIRGSALLLRDIVRSYGLDHIVSIEDPVWGTEKHRAFSSADVFVHTSRFEGHPMAVLEALSYGLPCLLTPGTNVADEVTAAGAGWQAEPTAACIAERLAEVIRERDALPAMSRRARDLVANQHTWGQVAGQVSDAYKEVIAQTSLCRRR
jgi:glycosyltransferase involved in cell wall biosynthesis